VFADLLLHQQFAISNLQKNDMWDREMAKQVYYLVIYLFICDICDTSFFVGWSVSSE
jgi:hypothetical protein